MINMIRSYWKTLARWRHLHQLQVWPPGGATCNATLPKIAVLPQILAIIFWGSVTAGPSLPPIMAASASFEVCSIWARRINFFLHALKTILKCIFSHIFSCKQFLQILNIQNKRYDHILFWLSSELNTCRSCAWLYVLARYWMLTLRFLGLFCTSTCGSSSPTDRYLV